MPSIDQLEQRILSAKARLDGAHAAYRHCPSAENADTVTVIAAVVDHWLDEWAARRTADALVNQ